ncbi:hypothetical protein PPOP_3586 [Paenibacillus popilliae ATCC 14706]|uniref:Uncharacterized protein n=1 Tax=Paenibacillus popilliae ATCC 14706 TaxID=1212764 RepID=M9M8D9_PAEPP|nr:hypothetical protein PPOP_3586 [Paenibacillus popilliae ATCC 14706]
MITTAGTVREYIFDDMYAYACNVVDGKFQDDLSRKVKKAKNSPNDIGANLSIATDLTAATLLMMDKDTQQRFVYQMYWLPRENFEKRVQKMTSGYSRAF